MTMRHNHPIDGDGLSAPRCGVVRTSSGTLGLNMRSGSAVFAVALFLSLFYLHAAADDKRLLSAKETPPVGYARLYIFRPDFSDVSRDENPTVTIDGIEVLQLAHKTYTSILLRPGAYEIATAPGAGEAGFWNGKLRISVELDRKHYLAIWNEVQVGAGSLSAITPYLGLLGVAMDNSVRSTAVRFEIVTEADALPVMKDLAYIASNKGNIEP